MKHSFLSLPPYVTDDWGSQAECTGASPRRCATIGCPRHSPDAYAMYYARHRKD